MCFFRSALFNQLISFSKTEFMTIQFSNNPGISVRICADLYRFAGSAQHGKFFTLNFLPFSISITLSQAVILRRFQYAFVSVLTRKEVFFNLTSILSLSIYFHF